MPGVGRGAGEGQGAGLASEGELLECCSLNVCWKLVKDCSEW